MNANRSLSALTAVLLAGVFTGPAIAQDQKTESPYTDLQQREIKALSSDEIEGLLRGDGLGMALPAELNGYPGPKHVLDMADELGLTTEQEEAVKAVFVDMGGQASALGKEIVEMERVLDGFFASSAIDETKLDEQVTRIAVLRGHLRQTHLAAHLKMVDLLDAKQRRHYQMLRGYGGHEHSGH